MSSNNQPLINTSLTPIARSSLNSLLSSVILDSDPGQSSFLISTGNQTSLYIDQYANTAINHSSPISQLDINSSNGACLTLRFNNTTNLANFTINSSGVLSINASGNQINTNNNLNILSHNGSTTGLFLNSVLVTASAIQLNYNNVIPGTASNSKSLVLDSNGSISGINSLSATSLSGTIQTASQPNITSLGTLSSLNISGNLDITGNLIVSGSTFGTDALGYITDITPGTASANKALVLNSSSSISGITSLSATTLSGTLGTASQPNITSVGTLSSLTVSGTSQFTSGDDSSSTTTGSLVISGGVGIAKNLYVGSNIFGTLGTASQPNITSVGTLTSLTVSGTNQFTSGIDSSSISTGSVIISGGVGIAKNLYVGGNTFITGNLTVSGATTTVSSNNITINDNTLLLNSGPSGVGKDAGIIIERYQINNDNGEGDVVNDTPKFSTTITDFTSTSITLDTNASIVDDFYNGWWIKMTNGTANNAVRQIISYNGTTKIATLNNAFTINPSNGNTVSLYNKSFSALVWQESTKTFTPSFLAQDNANTLNILDYAGMRINNLILDNNNSSASIIMDGFTILDSSRNISNINNLTASAISGTTITGTLQTASQPNISTLGNITTGNILTVGTITNNNNVTINGTGSILSLTSSSSVIQINGNQASTNSSTGCIRAVGGIYVGENSIFNSNLTVNGNIVGTLSTASQPNITSVGTLTSISTSGNLTIGSTIISETDIAKIDGITNGTASANKALILDTNRNITNINEINTTGVITTTIINDTTSILPVQKWINDLPTTDIITELLISNIGPRLQTGSAHPFRLGTNNTYAIWIDSNQNVNIGSNAPSGNHKLEVDGTVLATSYTGTLATASQPNITSLGTLSSLSISGNLTMGSTVISSSEIAVLDGITAGTASANKALVLNSSSSISGINSLSATSLTGTLATASQPNITSVGTLNGLLIQPTNRTVSPGQVSTNCVFASTQDRRYGMRQIDLDNFVMLCYSAGGTYNDYITWEHGGDPDLNISGSVNMSGLYINNTLVTSTAEKLNYNNITTEGVAEASKTLVVNNNRDISNIGHIQNSKITLTNTDTNILTIVNPNDSGGLQNILFQGTNNSWELGTRNNTTSEPKNGFYIYAGGAFRFVINTNGDVGINTQIPAYKLDVNGSFNATSYNLSGVSINMSIISGVTAGVAANNKVLSLNGSGNITGINALSATSLTGTIQTGAQPNITSLGNLSGLTINGNLAVNTSNGNITFNSGSIFTNNGVSNLINSTTIGGTNISAASWTTTGIQLAIAGNTYTNTSNAAASTAASAVITSFARPTITATNANVTITNAATVYIANSPTVSGTTTITNSYALWTPSGRILFGDTTSSTSTTTGALVVSGGVGIGGDVYIGGTNLVIGSVGSSSVGVGNFIRFRGTSGDSSPDNTHTVIGERIYQTPEKSELLIFKGNDASGTAGPDRIRYRGAEHVFQTYTSAEDFSGLSDNNTRLIIKNNGVIEISNNTTSTSTTNGALIITGGVGIGNNINIGGNANINGTVSITGVTTMNEALTFNNVSGNVLTIGNSSSTSIPRILFSGDQKSWEFGFRNSADGTYPNTLYIYDTTASAFRWIIDTSGNVNIVSHNNSSVGLQLGGTLVTSSATELNYLSGTTLGTASASKSLVIDSSRNIANINNISVNRIALGNSTNYRTILDCGTTVGDRILGIYNNSTDFYGFGASDSLLKIHGGANNGIAFYTDSSNSATGTLRLTISSTSTDVQNVLRLNPTTQTVTSHGEISGMLWYVQSGGRNLGMRVIDDNNYSLLTYSSGGNYNDKMLWNHNSGSPIMSILVKDLVVGQSGETTPNLIRFAGLSGDNNNNHTVIGERIYASTEKSELILFKGNDVSAASGPDRIRLRAGELVFQTFSAAEDFSGLSDNSTRLIINSDGKVGIGVANITTLAVLEVSGGSNQDGTIIRGSGDSLTSASWPTGWSGGLKTMDMLCQSINCQGLTQRSDIRLKENINIFNKGLKEVLELQPVSFKWKENNKSEDISYGFIAQEVEKILPEFIIESETGMKSIKDAFSTVFVNSIKELNSIINSQRDEIEEIKEKNKILEAKLYEILEKINN